MECARKQPHIQLSRSQTLPVVLVVGDPARVEVIASLCDKQKEIAYNREYRTFKCVYKDQSFLVTSHGIGSSGASICFEELIANGAKVIVRVGTAGTLQPDMIHEGDVVICNSAVREEGVTRLLVPDGFPAAADPYVCNTLQEIAATKNQSIRCGMTLSTSQFYKSPVLPSSLELYAKAHVDIVEMEVSALFVIARIRGIKAGAICVVDGSPLEWEGGEYNPTGALVTKGKHLMFQVALDAAARFAFEKNW